MFNFKTERWDQLARLTARIWSLVPILFMVVEIIFPHSAEGEPISAVTCLTLGLLAVSVLGLGFAWRWEFFGGWLSIVALILFLVSFSFTVDRIFPAAIIFLLAIGVPAGLFLISAYSDR